MSFLFSIILIATFGCCVCPFLFKDEVDYYKKMRNTGPVRLDVYIKTYDMLYETQDITFCDRGWDIRYNRCDYIMAYQFCFAKITPTEKWPYMKKNFRFIDSNKVFPKHPNNPMGNRGECRYPKIKLFPEQSDYFYFDYPNMIWLDYYNYDYTFQTGLIVIAAEEDRPPHIDVYGVVYAVGMTPNLTRKYSVHRYTKYIKDFDSTMLLEVALKLDCRDDFTGQTCWLKCESDHRQLCNCDNKFRASVEPCTVTCIGDWLTSRAFKVIEGFKYTLNACVYKNWCNKSQCSPEKICVPTGNNTGNCSSLNLNIITQFESNNMTNLVFFASERVVIFINTANLVALNLDYITIICVDLHKNEVYRAGVLNNYQQMSEITFTLLEKHGFVDINFTLQFKVEVVTLNIIRYKYKKFRIFVKPKSIFLWQKSGQETMRSVIIFGDHITCNSTGAPKYRIIIGLQVKVKGTSESKVKMGGSIFVQSGTSKVDGMITCLVELFSSERRIIPLHLNRTVVFRVMQYFEWRPNDNIILNTVLLKCIARTLLKHEINVFMLRGPYDVWTTKNSINLTMVKGGIYTFGCVLILPNSRRSIYKEFAVRALPTKVCFFLFARIRGALLQCSHNGYLKDEYNVTVSLILAKNPIMESSHFLRIPYELRYSKIQINCSVTALYGRNYQWYKTLEIEIERSTKGIYALTNEIRMCPQEEMYMEIPDVTKEVGKNVELNHYIFDFIEKDECTCIAICIITSFLFLSIGIILFLSKVIETDVGWKNYVARRSRWQRIRHLQDYLRNEATKLIIMEEAGIDIPFDKIELDDSL